MGKAREGKADPAGEGVHVALVDALVLLEQRLKVLLLLQDVLWSALRNTTQDHSRGRREGDQ